MTATGVLLFSIICLIIFGFIELVVAAAALGYNTTDRQKITPGTRPCAPRLLPPVADSFPALPNRLGTTTMPMNGPNSYLGISLVCSLYSMSVGIVGAVAVGNQEKIRMYDRKASNRGAESEADPGRTLPSRPGSDRISLPRQVLNLTKHFFRMVVADYIIQECLAIAGLAYAYQAREWRIRNGINTGYESSSKSAFQFGQAVSWLAGFTIHGFFVYWVWSYTTKLEHQVRPRARPMG